MLILKDNKMPRHQVSTTVSASDFADDEQDIAQRQASLASEIGRPFLGGRLLLPHARHSGAGEMPRSSAAGGAAWQVVADQPPPQQIIDHAWRLIECLPASGTAWDFVTEPYLRQVEPAVAHQQVAGALFGWPVTVHVLTRPESSWNPGSCLPIAVLAETAAALDVLIARSALRLGTASIGGTHG
jgi:hypothetical protein